MIEFTTFPSLESLHDRSVTRADQYVIKSSILEGVSALWIDFLSPQPLPFKSGDRKALCSSLPTLFGCLHHLKRFTQLDSQSAHGLGTLQEQLSRGS
jgi:hypothetical protein